jgi:hypothetical protein
VNKKALENQRRYRAKRQEDPSYVEENRLCQRLYDSKRRDTPSRKEYVRKRRRERVLIDSDFVEKEKLRLSAYSTTLKGKHAALKRFLKLENVAPIDLLWSLNFYNALISDARCHYCLGFLKPSGHGMDRIENNPGHVCYNVVPCCWACNELKGIRLSYEEMMLLAPTLQEIRRRRELAGD